VAKKSLTEFLEEEAGMEEFRFVLPHPFLPPRFQEVSQSRNLILLLDRDLTLHLRWEGARRHKHWPLTPRAAAGLIRDVLSRMTAYRKDMQDFSRFIERVAEQPFEDPRYDAVTKDVSPKPALPIVPETKSPVELVAEVYGWTHAQLQQMELLLSNPGTGGESPMGMGDFDE
jgi:hypothetical protein